MAALRPANQLLRTLLVACPRCSPALSVTRYLPQIRLGQSLIHTASGLSRKNDLPPRLNSAARPLPQIPADEKDLGDLVYVGSITRLLYSAKLLSITSSAMGIAIQPVLMEKMSDLHGAVKVLMVGTVGFFIFVTPILLHQLCKRYIMRLYYKPDAKEFTAITSRFVPAFKSITTFTADDVHVPATPGMFTSFLVQRGEKQMPLFVNPPEFLSDDAYIKLMRYDEPMDIIRGPQFPPKQSKK